MSQAELARRLKLTQPTISDLVRGDSQSSVHLHKIARELATTPAYLTGETDDPAAEHPEEQFTSEEREWVDLLRTLPTADRRATVRLLRLAASGVRAASAGVPQVQEVAS
jgi:transcriptional regulator with XRE-family HTH domain